MESRAQNDYLDSWYPPLISLYKCNVDVDLVRQLGKTSFDIPCDHYINFVQAKMI